MVSVMVAIGVGRVAAWQWFEVPGSDGWHFGIATAPDSRGWTRLLVPPGSVNLRVEILGKWIDVPPQSNGLVVAVNPDRDAFDEWTPIGTTNAWLVGSPQGPEHYCGRGSN